MTSTRPKEIICDQLSPVCLWPENPYGPVSLWEMLQFYADHFINLMSDLEDIDRMLLLSPHLAYQQEQMDRIIGIFGQILEYCNYLGFQSAYKQIERIGVRTAQSQCTLAEFKDMMLELRRRVVEDCESKVFFSITDPRIVLEFFKYAGGTKTLDTKDCGGNIRPIHH